MTPSGDVGADLRLTRAAVAARLATLDRLTREAAERVYYGESAGYRVVANVDGNGRLLALEIDPAALRAPHPERTGREVVAAITLARQVAAGERARRIDAHLGRVPPGSGRLTAGSAPLRPLTAEG